MSAFLSTTRWSRRWPGGRRDSDAALEHSPWELPGCSRMALYGAVLAAAGLTACATVPPSPTPEMTRAESAIEQAERAGAAELAPQPLQAAERKLSEAKTAAGQRDNAYAAQLVEESYADARLADLTAQSEKSAKAAAEVDKSIRTLENETTRSR
jgi:hypothetical protein